MNTQHTQQHAEELAELGWQYFECPACGSEGAKAFPKPEQEPPTFDEWTSDYVRDNLHKLKAQPEQAGINMEKFVGSGAPVVIPQAIPQIPQEHSSNEPAEYQVRSRPNWNGAPGWSDWTRCSKEAAGDYAKTPMLNDWEYEVRALYTSPPVQRKPLEPDMFWNQDDAETPHDSIEQFLNEEICQSSFEVEVGAVFTLLRAKKMPSVKIKVTSIDEEECEAKYEIIEADHGIKGEA